MQPNGWRRSGAWWADGAKRAPERGRNETRGRIVGDSGLVRQLARGRPPRLAGQEEAAGRRQVSDERGGRTGFVAARIGIRRVSHRAVSRVPGARRQAAPDFGRAVPGRRGASRGDAGLEPIFERRFSKDSYACRVGKGTHKALERAKW